MNLNYLSLFLVLGFLYGAFSKTNKNQFVYYYLVEYQSHPSGIWQPALYERAIIEKLRHEQFDDFVKRVQTTDCQAELRRLLSKGPPVYLQDPHALPLAKPDTDTHVAKLWFAADNTEQSAKLKGALEGKARDKLWDELREFLIQEGKEEGDDDEDDDANGA